MAGFLHPDKGGWVFLSFVGFFAVIIVVNAIFITMALGTHSGVVTQKPYDKGLAFDEVLDAAKMQPDIWQKASFDNGVLRWELKDEDGMPLRADVTARLIWPVKEGYDFELVMSRKNAGIYEERLNLPFKGQWQVQLVAKWQKSQYRTRFQFLAR
ncbi:MAG: FixH family protein [Alphaproteobacteria bacterium]|nr:FixH family protein [Alphaproteobacteria bacterium]